MSITIMLVILTCLVSYYGFTNPSFMYQWLHIPVREHRQKEYYRLVSSGFLHKDWMHLIINMFVLWGFGEYVEATFIGELGLMWGKISFLGFYILGIIFGNLSSFYRHKDFSGYSALGASGAVSGILFAFILFNPWHSIYLYFIIKLPAIVAGVLYLGYSHWADRNRNDNVGHDAHFYGAVFGFLFPIVLHPAWFPAFVDQLMSIL